MTHLMKRKKLCTPTARKRKRRSSLRRAKTEGFCLHRIIPTCYVIESVGKISGDVSMRDVTFQNSTGFPINRVEKIGYVRRLL